MSARETVAVQQGDDVCVLMSEGLSELEKAATNINCIFLCLSVE